MVIFHFFLGELIPESSKPSAGSPAIELRTGPCAARKNLVSAGAAACGSGGFQQGKGKKKKDGLSVDQYYIYNINNDNNNNNYYYYYYIFIIVTIFYYDLYKSISIYP